MLQRYKSHVNWMNNEWVQMHLNATHAQIKLNGKFRFLFKSVVAAKTTVYYNMLKYKYIKV